MSKIQLTSPRKHITDLDCLPMVDRSLVDYEAYNRYTGQAMVKNCLSLQATRGCPYKCTFCHKIWPKSHYYRSAENIYDEVKLYYDMGIRRFSFIDDIFNLNIKNSSRFFQVVIKNKLDVQLFFPGGFRGDLLTKDFMDLMIEAGTLNIAMALETASPRLQKLIRKDLNIDKLKENIDYICSNYPHVILELFTILGIPTETEEEAMLTLSFIKSLKWLHFPYISILKIFPNTEMEQLALEHGIRPEAMRNSLNRAFDEMPETLPFSKDFAFKFQALCVHEYVMLEERLNQVLPYQMKVLTEDEILQKYNSYTSGTVTSFDGLLKALGLPGDAYSPSDCADEDRYSVPDLNRKIREHFPPLESRKDALKILLLDVSQYFSEGRKVVYDVCEPPLGPMYLLSYLQEQLGDAVCGKIAKSRMDFDSFSELEELLEQFQPDVIGMRSLSLYREFYHETAARIRNWGFTGPLIAGGPYATTEYKTIFNDNLIDVVVLGEGEITFCQLIETIMENNGSLPGKEQLLEIHGIAYPSQDLRIEQPAGEKAGLDRQKILQEFSDDLEDDDM